MVNWTSFSVYELALGHAERSTKVSDTARGFGCGQY
jgi:hypothetical protein